MKRWMVVLILAFVVSIVHTQLFLSSWGYRIETLAIDLWFNLRGTVAPPEDIVLVSMDESSYKVLNLAMDQVWPRALHAKLLRRLAELGAKRVVMDILFLGPSSNPAADQELADSLKSIPTVIGCESGMREQGASGGHYALEEILEPLKILANNAEKVALARLPDDFGYVRRFVVPRSLVTKGIPTLAEAALGPNTKSESLASPRDFIWYYGPPGTIQTYPYHMVMDPEAGFPAETFKNKIVFVGLNLRTEIGPAQKDSYRTPFYERGSMFGVEIHATAAGNFLSNKWIRCLPAWVEIVGLFIGTFLLTAAIFWLKPQWAGAVLVGFALAWACGAYLSFLGGLFIPGALLVGGVLPISYLGSTLVYYLVTHREQQHVEKAFQLYLSPDMAKEMRKNPKGLELGGENIYATALFTDIAGFTDITESMNAAQVSTMLNAYFTEVMEVVFEKKGTLIKFIGDAAFVLWGAPIRISEHAQLACETALAIQREVRKFNDSKRFPPLHTRVGIHTGPMVVGNLGSKRRFDYTAIGDSVNLASRVEGINKYFGTTILITESTKKELAGAFKVLSLGSIKVVGRKENVALYALLEDSLVGNTEANWAKALNQFRLRRWDEAEVLFKEVQETERFLEKAAKLYLKEIENNRQAPPDDDWQGEVVFGSK